MSRFIESIFTHFACKSIKFVHRKAKNILSSGTGTAKSEAPMVNDIMAYTDLKAYKS